MLHHHGHTNGCRTLSPDPAMWAPGEARNRVASDPGLRALMHGPIRSLHQPTFLERLLGRA